FPTPTEWVDLLSAHHLLLTEVVDISMETANCLHDARFEERLQEIVRANGHAGVEAAFRSYDQLGKLFSRGLARYLLLTASKRTDLPTSELEALNRAALEAPVPFSEASLSAGRYEVEWLEKETAARRLAPGRWLIVPDRQGVAPALKARLEAVGERASLLAANGGARAVLE